MEKICYKKLSRLCTCNQQPPHPWGIAGTLTFSPANFLLKAPPSGCGGGGPWLQMTSTLKPEYIQMTLSQRICIVEINTHWHCEKKLTKAISFHRLSGTEIFQPSDKHIPLCACQRFFYSSLVLFICLDLRYMYFLKDAL